MQLARRFQRRNKYNGKMSQLGSLCLVKKAPRRSIVIVTKVVYDIDLALTRSITLWANLDQHPISHLHFTNY